MNEYYAINIARQLGSGGHNVAEAISKRLNIKMYDKQILIEAAKDSGINEQYFIQVEDSPIKRSFFNHFLMGSAYVNIYPSRNYTDSDTLFKFQSDSIRAIHQRENAVFVGRCADYILRDSNMCANFFICAKLEDRIKWVCEDQKCDENTAMRIIKDNDHHRSSNYNYYSGRTWGFADAYDLCLNTSILGFEKCADLIIETTLNKLNIKL